MYYGARDASAFSTIGRLTATADGRTREIRSRARRLRRQKGMRSDQSARPVAYNGHRSRLGCESRQRCGGGGGETRTGRRACGMRARVRAAAAAVLPCGAHNAVRSQTWCRRLVGFLLYGCQPPVPAAPRIITPHVRAHIYVYNIIL